MTPKFLLSTLTLVAAGTCTIRAIQAGTARYATVAIEVLDGPIVPDDAASLAEAAALALPGQAIGVRPGTWPTSVDLGSAGAVVIGLVGDGDAQSVVLDAQGAGSAVQASGALTLAHLTLTGGYADSGDVG